MSLDLSVNSRTGGFTRVIAAYLSSIATMTAIVWYGQQAGWSALYTLGTADIAGTLVIFLFSYWHNNSSFYDAYWSVWPPLAVVFTAWLGSEAGADPMRAIGIVACIWVWGVRLTANWARSWQGLTHEDWRYVDLRRSTGKYYWVVSLAGLHFFPTVMVWLAFLPAYAATALPGTPINGLDILAVAVCLGAVLVEWLSDEQLRRHRRQQPGLSIRSGLWAYSRHPNYLGELGFWWGLFLFAVAAGEVHFWTVAGALAMTFMFIRVSIPMMEKRMLARRPDYQQIRQTIPMLFPLMGKKRSQTGDSGV